ncbi:hypothetical protein NKJ59_31725 [Mesorhizobium australicum]|uniref:hypothetical protein n=1 Tax=Mesorhizobium australicum TaxID=536018 RepID=UPI00333607CA
MAPLQGGDLILRRAALMLRNIAGVALEPPAEDALDSIAAGMKISKPDLIQIVLSDWLETNAYLPVHELDDDKPDRRAWLTLIQRVAPMKPLKY